MSEPPDIDAGRIQHARAELAQYFEPTPLVRAALLSTTDRAVYLKDETVLPTGSFKVRGAIHALAANLARGAIREVVAASTGNHGAAVAYAARLVDIPARIFLPHHSNPLKVSRIRELGAKLVEAGNDLSAAIDAASAYVSQTGAFFLHDASDPDIPVGTATIGAEIIEQLPSLDVAYIPMGDTALIRGVASALRLTSRRVHVVGVVAAGAPAYFLSWKAGEAIETESARTIADGLAVRRPLAPNVSSIRRLVNEVVTVSEREMIDAIVRLRSSNGIVAEPSGAAALAALVRDTSRTGTCVALVTGRNLSPDIEAQVARHRPRAAPNS
jgi:threonine dehydratase